MKNESQAKRGGVDGEMMEKKDIVIVVVILLTIAILFIALAYIYSVGNAESFNLTESAWGTLHG
jgi:hypothetical protein